MSERTERSERTEGHERMPGRPRMSERTERSEGHERMPGRPRMSSAQRLGSGGTTATAHRRGAGRRIWAIGRAELLLLARNRTALFNALGLPVVVIAILYTSGVREAAPSGRAGAVIGACGFALLLAVYYNLVTTYVARREELVLKRLRVGELTDAEILVGAAGPSAAVAIAQTIVFVGAGAVVLGLPSPVNALLLVCGMVGGIVVFVLLAAASTAFTRTVETAQVTTLPLLVVCGLGAGTAFTPDLLPAGVGDALRLLPLTPVMELLRLGWLGTTDDSAPLSFGAVFVPAAVPAGILAAWVVVGVLAVRRWFRWEPRR